MKKHLIVIGIVVLLLAVGLSGCTDTGVNDGTKSSDIIEKTYFTLSGNITNNYAENIEIDCAIVTDELDGWEYWAPTIEFSSLESKDFGCEVKSGYLIYWFWIQIFYPDGSAGYFLNDFNFSNPLGEDMTYYMEVKNNGEIEIFTDYSHVSKNKSPSALASASVTSGNVPLTVLFTGIVNDTNGNIIEYHWDFGDGDTSNEQNSTHIFQEYGTYIVRMIITDNGGASDTDTVIISVKFPEPKIIEHNAWGEYDGYLNPKVFGIIKNIGTSSIKNVHLTVTLYDASNNKIDSKTVKTEDIGTYGDGIAPPIIAPQETAVFKIKFYGVSYYHHYSIIINSYTPTSEGPYEGVIITNHEKIYLSDTYWSYVDVTVKNTGSKVVNSASVVGIFYDINGNLADIEWASGSGTLYSGQGRGFKIDVLSTEPKITTYDLKLVFET